MTLKVKEKMDTKIILKPKTIYSLRKNEEYVRRYLKEFLKFEIYSSTVIKALRETHYELKKLPQDIQDITKAKLSDENTARFLSERIVAKAVNILESYESCQALEGVHYLSRAGHRTLKRLKDAMQKKQLAPEIVDEAMHTANKFLVNLDLFLPLSYLKQSNLFMTTRPVVFELKGNQVSEIENAKLMPFPVMMKAYELLSSQKEKGIFLLQREDEYCDPVMNASVKDVILFARTRLLQERPTILTSKENVRLNNALLINSSGTVTYHNHLIGYILNDKVKKVTSHFLHKSQSVRGAWELE